VRAERARARAELEAIEADLPERSGAAVEATRGTLVLIHGVAPLGVRRAFARLGD
jgi:hypothetical protein